MILLTLALPMPGWAQQLPNLPFGGPLGGSDDVRIYVQLGQWRRLADDRIEVQTRSGAWIKFPPAGMATSGEVLPWMGLEMLIVRLHRSRLGEVRRIIEEEVPPHKWGWFTHVECQVDCGRGSTKF